VFWISSGAGMLAGLAISILKVFVVRDVFPNLHRAGSTRRAAWFGSRTFNPRRTGMYRINAHNSPVLLKIEKEVGSNRLLSSE